MSAYYNEFDPFAAAWLRELIEEGLIAPGEVDERSIEDVAPEDTKGFIQCHFFAGIGIWSLSLRLAGWEDNREIWTGSCPCQPFSAAGKGAGFDDERHLWPAFDWLIGECRPDEIVGEQVASSDGLHWLDLVSTDLEGKDYAFGPLDTCAAGFSAPHIRQRGYWNAQRLDDALRVGRQEGGGVNRSNDGIQSAAASAAGWLADAISGRSAGIRWGRKNRAAERGISGGVADPEGSDGRSGLCDLRPAEYRLGEPGDRGDLRPSSVPGDPACGVGQPVSGISGDGELQSRRQHGQLAQDTSDSANGGVSLHPLNYWADADWLLCRDPDGPRWRPVEPGSFPLVDAGALRNRLVEVRGAGNAINLAQAQGFLEAVMECRP